MGILMTSLLFLVAQGGWLVASLLYIFALIGFSGGNIFYDALLVNVAGGRRVDIISGLGYALGYLGGGVLFAINIWMISKPETFGLQDASHAVRWSFLAVAIWWALFSIPVFIFVKEPALQGQPKQRAIIRAGLQQLLSTLKSIASYKTVVLFLLAYWFYIDGVDTVVRMAVDYGLSLGLDSKKLLLALLLAQLVGFPSALAFGFLGQWIGPKKGIYTGLIFYIVVLIWAMGISSNREFYMLAIAIGLVQGGIQALSRSLYVRIIPQDKAGEFFGFYNIFGKFAAVLGPVLMGTVGLLSGDPRKGLMAIIFLFIIGGVFLYFVNYDKSDKS
jgi:MFS transporter, UMF1 family